MVTQTCANSPLLANIHMATNGKTLALLQRQRAFTVIVRALPESFGLSLPQRGSRSIPNIAVSSLPRRRTIHVPSAPVHHQEESRPRPKMMTSFVFDGIVCINSSSLCALILIGFLAFGWSSSGLCNSIFFLAGATLPATACSRECYSVTRSRVDMNQI